MPRIFISYRRADTEYMANLIYHHLAKTYGKKWVFKDVYDIRAGKDFRKEIHAALEKCDVALVLIGEKWLDITEPDPDYPGQERRRLDNPVDPVRTEVRKALEQTGTRVIPLLIDSATMPDARNLPPDLQDLAPLNALRIRKDPDFPDDMRKVINAIGRPLPAFILPVMLLIALVAAIALIYFAFFSEDDSQTAAEEVETATFTVVPSDTPVTTETPAAEPTFTHTPSETVAPTNTASLPPSDTSTASDTPTETFTPSITPTSVVTATLGYPCEATVTNPGSSATVVNNVYTEPSTTSPRGASARVGNVVIIQRHRMDANSDVWYLIYNSEGQRYGWIPSQYVFLSKECPSN